MQTIVLVRHGHLQSWLDKPKARGGEPHLRIDPALSELGGRQAALTAAHLAGTFDAVLSSPFRSCLATADALAGATPVAADWRLGQVLISSVLGCPFSPTAGMDPDWAERRAGAGKPSHPESDRTVQERLGRLLNDLRARKPFAGRLALVSHDIILKALVGLMTGREPKLDWHPAAIAVLVRAKPVDRQWRLSGELGAFRHLGDADRCEPADEVVVKYHPLDSRS